MTVEETFKFAFDSMSGGTHGISLREKDEGFSDEQKELVSWMDSKYFKVRPLSFLCRFLDGCASSVLRYYRQASYLVNYVDKRHGVDSTYI